MEVNPVFDYKEWMNQMKGTAVRPMSSNPIVYHWDVDFLKELSVEEDPTGAKDKKYDQGKAMVGLMKSDFSKALELVAGVTTYGVEKYKQPGSWRFVDNALDRYEDALGRHDLALHSGEEKDPESGLLHAAHRAWNALATLELIITKLNKQKSLSGKD